MFDATMKSSPNVSTVQRNASSADASASSFIARVARDL
jgi:hypothetical protein